MKVLFTCAGRRNYLLNYFKEIPGVTVLACDASKFAPALYEAHEWFLAPLVSDKEYIQFLLEESIKKGIDAVISLNDMELPVLSEYAWKFEQEGIKIIISEKKVIDLCFDKFATVEFTSCLPVDAIPTFLNPKDAFKYQEAFPETKFIIKPRWGTASHGLAYPDTKEEVQYLFDRAHKDVMKSQLKSASSVDYENCIIIQKRINGTEYGMDVINNLNGEYESTLLREKIEMRGGETDKAKTILNKRFLEIGEAIGKELGHIGNLDCDLFLEEEKVYLLEMNPRFGGGYPFMHYAGANLPLALVEWLKGNKTPKDALTYSAEVISAKVDMMVGMSENTNNDRPNLYILGAGGFGREIETWVSKSKDFNNRYLLKGFLDDNADALENYPSNYKVLGTIDNFTFEKGDCVLLGIADPEIKRQIIQRLNKKVNFVTFISDQSIIGNSIQIGEGTVIAPNVVLSTNIQIEPFVTINLGTQIGHDSNIGEYSSLMAHVNLSGNVKIEQSVYVGSNATFFPGISIGKKSKVSAGSIVCTNVKAESLMRGNPARDLSGPLKK